MVRRRALYDGSTVLEVVGYNLLVRKPFSYEHFDCLKVGSQWKTLYGYGFIWTYILCHYFHSRRSHLKGLISWFPWYYLCIFCISKTLNCEYQQASWKYSSKNEFHFYLIATVCLTFANLKLRKKLPILTARSSIAPSPELNHSFNWSIMDFFNY